MYTYTNDFIFKKLLIYDGSNCLHRAIESEALWNLNNNNQKTGGLFGVMQTILKEFKLYPTYYPVVVFDGNLSKNRLNIYPNYKHHAEKSNLGELSDLALYTTDEKTDEYIRQRDILIGMLPLINIPVIRLENWEGDDIIAYLSKITAESIIISEDKDLYQLISQDNPNCSIKHGISNEFVTALTLINKDMTPSKFLIFKALLGDVSDNIPPACPKVGDKYVSAVYKLYEHCVTQNITYPKTTDELSVMCAELDVPYRKALINFNEEQFLKNISLINLNPPIEPISPLLGVYIQNIIQAVAVHDIFLDVDLFLSGLNENGIKSINVNSLLDALKRTKKYVLYGNF